MTTAAQESLKTEQIDEKAKDVFHLQSVLRHIRHVQDGCNLLGERLMARGEHEFGRLLIQRGLIHDSSKLLGGEWDHLRTEQFNTPEFITAFKQHVQTNDHHPECWGSIRDMPRIAIAEMVCDWYARSTEMGTDLRVWIKDQACPKYNMTPQTKAYKTIMDFVNVLLDPTFKPVGKR